MQSQTVLQRDATLPLLCKSKYANAVQSIWMLLLLWSHLLTKQMHHPKHSNILIKQTERQMMDLFACRNKYKLKQKVCCYYLQRKKIEAKRQTIKCNMFRGDMSCQRVQLLSRLLDI